MDRNAATRLHRVRRSRAGSARALVIISRRQTTRSNVLQVSPESAPRLLQRSSDSVRSRSRERRAKGRFRSMTFVGSCSEGEGYGYVPKVSRIDTRRGIQVTRSVEGRRFEALTRADLARVNFLAHDASCWREVFSAVVGIRSVSWARSLNEIPGSS